jgi:hypothetical protein
VVDGIGAPRHHVVDDQASFAVAVALVLDGVALELDVADEALAADVYDELRRVVPIRVVGADDPAGLDADQRRLLDLVARGATVREAAARSNLSLRTAYRRLAEARAHLGVDTNLAAFRRLYRDREIGSH